MFCASRLVRPDLEKGGGFWLFCAAPDDDDDDECVFVNIVAARGQISKKK